MTCLRLASFVATLINLPKFTDVLEIELLLQQHQSVRLV